MVTHDKGKTIKIIINELNRVGYDVTYKVLTSLEYGVPQMRQRVYFVGIRKDLGKNIGHTSFYINIIHLQTHNMNKIIHPT